MSIDLSQFYGTEHYYVHSLTGSCYTDGVKYFADKAQAYWFIDLVMTEYHEMVKKEGFLSITLKVSDSKAVIDVSDGNDVYAKERHIAFTDCPAGEYQFFFVKGKPNVLMVSSEY